MRTLLALSIALALSLLGNAYQWRNSGIKTAATGGVLNLCTTANDSNVDALAQVSARMWECVGESQRIEIANTKAAGLREAATIKALADSAERERQVANAYRDPDGSKWGAMPVPPAVSRLYTTGSDTNADRAGARPDATGDSAKPVHQ